MAIKCKVTLSVAYGRLDATTPLYKTDFYAWTQQQAALLQAEELEKLDLPNLAEEIEAIGASQRKEIESRVLVLLMPLLKLHDQPRQHPNSWLRTIRAQRNELEFILSDSPSLHRELPAALEYVSHAPANRPQPKPI